MKHNIPVILWMSAFFLVAQFIGLAVLYNYIDVDASIKSGRTEFRDLELAGQPLERPQVQESSSFAYIMVALLMGTALMLLLMKFKFSVLWKAWFALAVILCLGLALSAFIPSWIALIIAGGVGAMKVWKPNWWVQTFTELFMYSGLAVIFVPIMNLFASVMLLILISAYDMYAVWHSKHMIAMAQFQASERMFAGLVIPYEDGSIKTSLPSSIMHKPAKLSKVKASQHVPVPKGLRTAILGGGDIGFPLMFAGVVMKSWGLIPSLIIPFTATASLIYLFVKGEDGKFYPAMPFLTVGCFVGLAIAWFIS